MIWENIQDFFIIQKKGKEGLLEFLKKSGHTELLKEIEDEKRYFMFSIGKGVFFLKFIRDVEEIEVYIGISEDMKLKPYDSVPVKICFLAILPKNKEEYVKFISHFFRLINIPSVRNEILKSKTVEEVKGVLKRELV